MTPSFNGNAATPVWSWQLLIVIGLLVFGGLVFVPGVDGPFVFDDQPNLLSNEYLKIDKLDWGAFQKAAYSSYAGPFKRPIPMASFALNSYFAGGLHGAFWFKVTNIAIHIVNGILLFWFLHLLFARFVVAYPKNFRSLAKNKKRVFWLAGTIALLWLVHPIQLTSVLYVVQRMVSLAALFTLLALICYLIARERLRLKEWRAASTYGIGVVASGFAAVLSKENALVLPFLIVLLELFLFHSEPPFGRLRTLPRRTRQIVAGVAVVATVAAITWVIHHAAAGYAIRDFTMIERLLTEARVLWFYISLIVAPRLTDLGLNHDDIALSTSLVAPWSTLPAVIGIVALIALAFMQRDRFPLLGIGILWFFAAHSLESSVFALEIAHEHRNYLPSVGILLPLVHIADYLWQKTKNQMVPLALMVILTVAVGAVSLVRSDQWSSVHELARFEAMHHPLSARAKAYLATSLAQRGHYEEAMVATRHAAQLDLRDPLYLINMHVISSWSGLELSADERRETEKRLRITGLTPSSFLAIDGIGKCLTDRCASLSKDYARWVQVLLDNPKLQGDRSYLHYLLGRSLTVQGRTEEALAAFDKASRLDSDYLHPRLEAIKLMIETRQTTRAKQALQELRVANSNSRYPLDKEVAAITAEVYERLAD